VSAVAVSARNAKAGAVRGRSGPAGRAAVVRPGSEDPAPGRVAEIQRQRIIAAVTGVAGERGAANVTVAHIVARAGVSRRTFYELFVDREACLLAALDEALAAASAVVLPAYASGVGWRGRVRGGLGALLRFLDEQPGLGRLLVVEALGAGDQALERRACCMAALIAAIDRGREEIRRGQQPPPLTAEGVVGAVFAIVHARVLARDAQRVGESVRYRCGAAAAPLVELCSQLTAVIVLPYLGQSAAQKELGKANPPPLPTPRPRRDPLEGLRMRLTYRTVRVLTAIAAHPGVSNRMVAQGSGIADQGQISKLLARLEGLGLIANSGSGQPRGAPNAWQLTARGCEIERAVRVDRGTP
jgi:AcrR family transcriptional regulator